jgi:uncharacterized damage-inducible protein DinB
MSAAADPSPVIEALQSFLGRYSKNLVGAAQAMPADKYGYSPTEQQMTFGHLVAHVAGSNNYLCANLSGLERPETGKLDESDKDALVQAMQASFDFCSKAVGQVNDSRLTDQVDFFGGRKVSKAIVVLDLAADWGDHYGQAANYLRLNGVLPPTARRESDE